MSVNKFDGVGFVRSMSQSARDLQAINNAWPSLSWFHRKRLFLWFMFEVMKQQAGRAVIVSACVRVWVISSAVIVPTASAFGDLVPAGYVLFVLTCYAGR